MQDKHLNCNNCVNSLSNPFHCLKKNSMELLMNEKEFEGFKKGSYLFKSGETADKFFCIQSGLVRTYKSLDGKKEQTFFLRTGGEWVGCRDVILSETYNYSTVCMNDVEACVIKKETLEKLVNDPEFQKEMLRQLAKHWKEMEDHLYSVGTKQIHSKLAEFLITFQGIKKDNDEINLSISRKIIGSIIGATTESVIRTLSDFKNRDWIDINKSKIIFKDVRALKSISEIDEKRIAY